MPSFAEMMALKAKANQPAQPTNGKENESNESVGNSNDATSPAESNESSAESTPVASQPERISGTQVATSPAPTAGIKLGGIKLGTPAGNSPAPAAATGSAVSAPRGTSESSGGTVPPARVGVKLGGLSLGGVAGKSSAAASSDSSVGTPAPAAPAVGNLGLLDIASLGEDSGPAALDFDRTIQDADGDYLDQVPATAPDRKIPEGADEIVTGFCKSLDTIYNLHNDREMFVSVVSRIMSDMQENKSLVKLLAPEDVNAIMKGMRQAAGMAQVKKQKAVAKRKGGKETATSAKLASAMDSLLSVAGFDLSSLN